MFDFVAMRDAFFDSEKVRRSLDEKERRTLSKMGAFVRRRAKSSLRYRDRPSEPGQPPSVHRRSSFTRTTKNRKTGESVTRNASPLRELVYFAYDGGTRSTVVGPALFRKSSKVVEALEKGGSIVRTIYVDNRGSSRARRARSDAQAAAFRRKVLDGSIVVARAERLRVTVTIAPRPTMQPAMEAELPNFAPLMRG